MKKAKWLSGCLLCNFLFEQGRYYEYKKSRKSDLASILRVYEIAREYMRNNGNPNQWGTDKPQKEIEIVKNSIEQVLNK